VYRSVICEAILKRANIEATSAGFRPGGRRAAKKLRNILAEHGLDVSEHRSKQVTPDMMRSAGMIVYMDSGNLKRIKDMCPTASFKTLNLASLIGDKRFKDLAFVRSEEEFRTIVYDIMEASARLASMLTSGKEILIDAHFSDRPFS